MVQKVADYYDVLGLERTASDADIKKAYHRLAKEHHPDLHSGKDKNLHTQRMQEVNEAYGVLISKENRAKYDELGDRWKDGAPPPPDPQNHSSSSSSSEEGFNDFFSHMFRQREQSEESRTAFPSEMDIEAVLDLSLKEAVYGVEKTFSLMTTGLCQTCHGTGRNGKTLCSECGGVGEVRRQRDVKTKIPAGLHNGSRIRLKGQGNEGPHGRGDLFLQIRLLPDPHFSIDGINLAMDARLMPWQAALGSTLQVHTLDGPVQIRIPKGTHTGSRLRVAGKGLGKPGKRGDLFVRFDIDIPNSLSTKAESLFKQLEDEIRAT